MITLGEIFGGVFFTSATPRRVDRESGGEQTLLQAATDAMEQAGGASAVTDACEDIKPRIGCRVQALVP